MFQHILIPTDGSDLSKRAVERGVTFAQEIRAKVTFLTVVEPFDVIATDSRRMAQVRLVYEQHAKEQAADALQIASSLARDKGVPFDSVETENKYPYKAIVEAAENLGCDLIAMASHGRKGAAAIVLGSETTKVLAHSSKPVLVYR